MSRNSYTDEILEKCYMEYKEGKSITAIAKDKKLDRHHLSKKLKNKYNINSFKKKKL